MKTNWIILFFILLYSQTQAQQNILDETPWTEGSGNIPGFEDMKIAESLRQIGIDPFGNDDAVLWKCIPNIIGDYLDGGFSALATVTLNSSKPYQMSMWVKQNVSNIGIAKVDMWCRTSSNQIATLRLDGSSNSSRPIHEVPMPIKDTWLLVVSYIYPADYIGEYNLGGIFDPTTGDKIATTGEFEFTEPNPTLKLRGFFNGATSTSESAYFFDPRVYEVNGNEPSINALMGLPDSGPGGNSFWTESQNGNGITYDSNVGIGADANSSYELAVGGEIISEGVRVKLQNEWPDYIFSKEYKLPTLEEIQKHIDEKGHLPKLPSANEVEANGIELGEMNRLLLEKIEELTLYILDQDKKNKQQQLDMDKLRKDLMKLESKIKDTYLNKVKI